MAEVELAELLLAREIAAQQARCDAWQREAAAARAAGTRLDRRRRPVPPEQYCRVRQARAKLDRARERAAARAAREQARAAEEVIVRNITDPGSRLMHTRNGTRQSYNAQNVTSEDGLVIATELTDDPADTAWFEPMMNQAGDNARLIREHQPGRRAAGAMPGDQAAAAEGQPPDSAIGLVLADAGYLSRHNLTCPGPDRLIATGKRRDLEKRTRQAPAADTSPPPDGDNPVTAMTARLATGNGMTAYRQRGHIAETPHGNIKHNMGFSQLSLRGKPRAAAEWTFTCIVHNLFKAISSSHLTHQAIDALQPATAGAIAITAGTQPAH